jgi:hypothetical protein
VELDARRETPEQALARRADERRIRINRLYVGPEPREAKGQSPFAATDLKNAAAAPIRDLSQRVDFMLFRVDSEWH